MVDCDWCGAPMDRIGGVVTGMMKGRASVWLCRREGCGHEREVFDGEKRESTVSETTTEASAVGDVGFHVR